MPEQPTSRHQKLTILVMTSQSAEAKSQAYTELTLDGASIEDLALDFTLPGYAEIPLKVSGKIGIEL